MVTGSTVLHCVDATFTPSGELQEEKPVANQLQVWVPPHQKPPCDFLGNLQIAPVACSLHVRC